MLPRQLYCRHADSKTYCSDDDVQGHDGLAVAEANNTTAAGSADLWSAAYQEAVNSFEEEVRSVILKGESIERLFTSLEETHAKNARDSLFVRGVQRLQAPLRNLKLALDMAGPLTSIEPIASTAVGVVSIVTAVSLLPAGIPCTHW